MAKKTNSQIVLEQIIKDGCASNEELTIGEFFEIFSAAQILKDYDLSYDDIKYSIVGNGGDGGIDSIFTFVNGELLKEDTVINPNQKKNHVEFVIIQSKTTHSFSESAVVKFRETAEDLFNLSNNPDKFKSRYNTDIIDKVNIFRNVYEKLAKTFPKMDVRYYYATYGEEVHPNVEGKVTKLREKIVSMFGGADFKFEFISASRLLELTRNTPSASRILEIAESPIATAEGSYLCLVPLSKYYEFISDSGDLARSIFESNVRDYQGSVVVNTGIRKTLENPASDNFWYLNNGVTIISPRAVLAGKSLTIEDPQIVNGLQTSHEIHRHFANMQEPAGDSRAILVRVLCEENEEARDRIIRATNSQTSIPPASLRSSDEIHRNIEDFLKANGYYYDRKKNFYKNEGKPVSKIISIPFMAQAMMAITLLKPDGARARPSTLINSEADYRKIFSMDIPIDVYLKVVQIIKIVDTFLKPENCTIQLERKTITNAKYYVAMLVGIALARSKEGIIERLAELPKIDIPTELLESSLNTVLSEYKRLGGTDQVAKGPNLVSALLG